MYVEFGASDFAVISIGSPTTPWLGVTVMLTIVCGVVKGADFVPVNGIAGISGIPAGAISVVGIGASAPCAGVTTAMVSSAASPARSTTFARVPFRV